MSQVIRAPKRATWHDAYAAQMDLWRWYRTREGQRFMAISARANILPLMREKGMQPAAELLRQLYEAELHRLIDHDPIYVSEEMCELIDAAQQLFKPEPLLETDVLTPRGFLWFAKPFVIPDRFDDPTTIHAVSWSRIFGTDDKAKYDDVQRLMRTAHSVQELDEQLTSGGYVTSGLAITLYCEGHELWKDEPVPAGTPPVVPMHLTPWYFDMTFDGNEDDVWGEPTGAGWWWRIVQATLRIMQQKIAHKSIQRPDRAMRREAKRAGARDEAEVVVVRLRREQGDENLPPASAANYSHRFIVGGHWRNQPYKSEGVIRQIWISPYVKGDPGLPLIVRPRRVYTWTR